MAKNNETVGKMAFHGALIGAAAFLYMGAFGHGAPTALRGPFFKPATPGQPQLGARPQE